MPTTILLAEDDEDHTFFTVRAMKGVEGHEVRVQTVRDGEAALDYLHQRGDYAEAARPDLVVVDLKMPKLSGVDVVTEMKSTDHLRAIPVVVFSSSDRPEDITDCYAGGANSYVTKPANLAGLRAGAMELTRYWLDVAALPQAG